MVSKNQENYESWLVGFWVSKHSKKQKISASNLFFALCAAIMDLLITLK